MPLYLCVFLFLCTFWKMISFWFNFFSNTIFLFSKKRAKMKMNTTNEIGVTWFWLNQSWNKLWKLFLRHFFLFSGKVKKKFSFVFFRTKYSGQFLDFLPYCVYVTGNCGNLAFLEISRQSQYLINGFEVIHRMHRLEIV